MLLSLAYLTASFKILVSANVQDVLFEVVKGVEVDERRVNVDFKGVDVDEDDEEGGGEDGFDLAGMLLKFR